MPPTVTEVSEKHDLLAARVDAVAGDVCELKATVKLIGWMLGLTLPSVLALLAFLTYTAITTAAELKTVGPRLDRIESRLDAKDGK